VSIETVRGHTRSEISPDQDANINMAIERAQKAVADTGADEEMKGRI
tara:strand:- start:54 stop:194 length:141 start_codon:yes stop_codon:yes gene_type:complete